MMCCFNVTAPSGNVTYSRTLSVLGRSSNLIADGRAGAEVARLRRSRQHGAPAGQRHRVVVAQVPGEPALQDGLGDRGEAALLDGGAAGVPHFRGADLVRRVAEPEAGGRKSVV